MSKSGPMRPRPSLSKLLDRVEKGERFVITRHGAPWPELTQSASGTRRASGAQSQTAFQLRDELAAPGGADGRSSANLARPPHIGTNDRSSCGPLATHEN